MTDEQLSALLRLKRHEQPPPGYFDDLLHAVQRRQREELLQRPLWRLAAERWHAFFSQHSMSPLSYGGAFAALMLSGILAIHAFAPASQSPFGGGENLALASAPAPGRAAQGKYALSLQPGPQPEMLLAADELTPQSELITHTPRYVIDTRPVSYEPLYSF